MIPAETQYVTVAQLAEHDNTVANDLPAMAERIDGYLLIIAGFLVRVQAVTLGGLRHECYLSLSGYENRLHGN